MTSETRDEQLVRKVFRCAARNRSNFVEFKAGQFMNLAAIKFSAGPAYAAQFVNAKTKKSVCPETSQTAVVPCGRPSPRTVLYGETVEEIQVKDNRETRVERFYIIEAIILGGVDPNPVRTVPVRAKQLYALAEMKHFLPNVTIYTLESSTKDTDKPLSGSSRAKPSAFTFRFWRWTGFLDRSGTICLRGGFHNGMYGTGNTPMFMTTLVR
ncbi:hypothetical protein quinque_008867 [Culex quinquefasciatus]